MVYLYMVGADAGMASVAEVKAPYATLEDAQHQAEHDLARGLRVLRIEDEDTGDVLWEAEEPRKD